METKEGACDGEREFEEMEQHHSLEQEELGEQLADQVTPTFQTSLTFSSAHALIFTLSFSILSFSD